jgi:hypothetical protein
LEEAASEDNAALVVSGTGMPRAEFLLGIGNEYATGEHQRRPAQPRFGVHLRAVIDQIPC